MPKNHISFLNIFNGNIRDCFDFFQRALAWISDENYQVTKDDKPNLDTMFDFVSRYANRRFMMSKSYRLVEMLLHFRQPIFLNKVYVDWSNDIESKNPGAGRSYRLSKNTESDTFVDNVFNYIWRQHPNENRLHYLLLKIRVLQIVQEAAPTRITRTEIFARLREFGYVGLQRFELDDAFVTLLHAGFLMPHYRNREMSYTMMPKGSAVAKGLIFSSVYWEHIFYSTLVPDSMLDDKVDRARGDSLDDWIQHSIRNYLTLLTYFRFVETHTVDGASVPDHFRIAERVGDSLWRSVNGMIHREYKRDRSEQPFKWLANRAFDDAHTMIAHWRSAGIVTESS